MSKATRQVFEQLKSGEPVETGKPLLPGLTLGKILSDIRSELKDMGAHGVHEMAAALFNGSGFVMYPRGTGQVEDPQHGLPIEAVKPPEVQQDRGMEM